MSCDKAAGMVSCVENSFVSAIPLNDFPMFSLLHTREFKKPRRLRWRKRHFKLLVCASRCFQPCLCCTVWAKYAITRLVCKDLKQRQRRKDSLLFVHIVVKTRKMVILRCCFDEYRREMYKNACSTCSTVIFSSFNSYYYTSDSLWKIWLVESIQSIHSSVISAADITFIMSSSTSAWLLSPLECSPQKQNGWRFRFCFWGWIMWKMYNKTIIEFGFRMISWIIKTEVCVICRSRRLRQITQKRGFDNSWYHAQPHFVSRESQCFPEVQPRETLRFEGNKMNCSPRGQSLSDLLYSTKRKTCNGNNYGGRRSTLGSLSTRVFETRTATRSELFSLLTCFHTTTFTLLSIFSPLEMISIKIWEKPLSWHAKFSLPFAVRVSKTRMLKLPNREFKKRQRLLEWGSSTWLSSLTSGCYTQLWSHSHRSPSS